MSGTPPGGFECKAKGGGVSPDATMPPADGNQPGRRRGRSGPGTGRQRGRPEVSESLPLDERLRLREAFFRDSGIDPRQFLQALDRVSGLYYFVKDARSRTMLNTREYAQVLGHRTGDAIVGKRPGEYLSRDLAEHYEADDRTVVRTGRPLLNIIEIGFNEQGVPDWIVTDKYPLRDVAGRVVGIVGIMQSMEGRVRALPHLGEVGKAAAYVRANLGERFDLGDVANHVGVSRRHLQRLFHKLVGITVRQFVIHSRVHAAAQELTHSTRAISEIALAFGFADQAAFTNTFRKATGVTPGALRRRHGTLDR